MTPSWSSRVGTGALRDTPATCGHQKAEKMLQRSWKEERVRLHIRVLLSQATEVRLDRQGRASLPKKLLDRAGISDRLVVIGALDHLEFWEPEAWQGYLSQAEPTLEEVAETLDL